MKTLIVTTMALGLIIMENQAEARGCRGASPYSGGTPVAHWYDPVYLKPFLKN